MPGPSPVVSPTFAPEVKRSLGWIFAARFVINTATRMVYSFLPAFGRGTGLSTGAMTWILFARDMAGLTGPVAGKAARELGRWRLSSMALAMSGLALVVSAINKWGFAVGMVWWGICGVSVLVGANSWIAESVPYARRGRATGIIEFTWASSALVGLPLVGVVIDTLGWRAAPALLGIITMPLGVLMARNHPHTGATGAAQHRATGAAQYREAEHGAVSRSSSRRVRLGVNANRAIGAMSILMGAAQGIFYGHGLWLESTYGFSASQVGFAIISVGGAEAVASFGIARFSDRIGKRNAALVGALILAVASILLGMFSAPPLVAGLAMLVGAFLGFEFGIVGSIAMAAELAPDQREAVVGRTVALTTLARGLGVLVAGFIYARVGFAGLMVWSAGLAGAAIFGFIGVHEPTGQSSAQHSQGPAPHSQSPAPHSEGPA